MRYKSRILSLILAAICAISALADNEVIINISPRQRILPPSLGAYIEKAGDLFNVSITNPLDEAVDVYLSYTLEQMDLNDQNDKPFRTVTSATDLDPSSPENYKQDAIITLPPSSTKMLSGFELQNAIDFYPLQSEYISGLDTYNASELRKNLLSEGRYQLTLHAFRTLGHNGRRPALSNPDLSKTDFWVLYKITPAEFFGFNVQKRVIDIDDGKNADGTNDMFFRPEYADCPLFNFRTASNDFNWTAPGTPGQLAGVFNFTYEFEIYRFMKGTTLDELETQAHIQMGSKVTLQSVPDLSSLLGTYLNVPPQANLTEFGKGDYYAIRLRTVNTNQQDDVFQLGYSLIENDGYSQWLVIRTTTDDVNTQGNGDNGAVVPVVGFSTILNVPKITKPSPAESGFKRSVVDSNADKLTFEWDAPKLVEATSDETQKKVNGAKWVYKLAIYYKGSSEDIDEITKSEPLYLKAGHESTSLEILYQKELAEKLKVGRDYIMVITAAPHPNSGLTQDEICWTGNGSNCYAFSPYAITPRKFDGCYKDEAPTEMAPKTIEVPKNGEAVVYVGGTKNRFPLHITSINSSSQQNLDGVATPVYNGSGYVEWTTGIAGKVVKVAVDFVGLAVNKQNDVIAGDVVSSKMTGTGIDWIPYETINAAIAKAQGFAGDVNELCQNAIDALDKGIDTAIDNVFDAIKAGTVAADDAVNSIIDGISGYQINAELGSAAEVTQDILTAVLDLYGGDYIGDLMGSINIGLGDIDPINIPNLSDAEIKELKNKYASAARSSVQGFFNKFQEEVNISPEFIKSKCGKYWKYIDVGGKQIGDIAILSGISDGVITLPLRVPNDFWTTGSDKVSKEGMDMLYDLSIMRMEFGPDRAQVSALMLANMTDAEPEGGEISNVLAFAAPRLCIRPGELLPETGEFGLLYDFGYKDCSTGFQITFNACSDWGDKDFTKADEKTSDWTNYNSTGCWAHWEGAGKEGKNEVMLSVGATMTIPNLYTLKDENAPELQVGGQVFLSGPNAGNWLLQGKFLAQAGDEAGFRIPECKDLKFYCGALVIDMSEVSSSADAVKPSDKYDWRKYFGTEEKQEFDVMPVEWKGVCLQKVEVELLQFLNVTEEEGKSTGMKKKLRVGIDNLIIDKTGISMTAALKSNMLRAGDMSGWYISLDEIGLDIVQSEFEGCYFTGKVGVPIISQKVRYRCDLNLIPATEVEQYAQENLYTKLSADGKVQASNPVAEGEKAFYVNFKTYFDSLAHVNLGIAALHFHEKGTWMEIKYLEGYETQAEFMASGTITLGGNSAANEDGTGSHPGGIAYEIPGMRFTGLRVANFSLMSKRAGDKKSYGQTFIDNYIKALENDKVELWGLGFGRFLSDNHEKYGLTYEEYGKFLSDALLGDEDLGNREINFGGNGYFCWGAWSLASEEKSFFDMPLKIDDIAFKLAGQNKLGITIGGLVALLKDEAAGELTAGLSLNFDVQLITPPDLTNLSEYALKFLDPTFDGLKVLGSFASGMVYVDGHLKTSTDMPDNVTGTGFRGDVTINIKGLCDLTVAGGWFDCLDTTTKEKFKSLFFAADGEFKSGILVGPEVYITTIMGGFYFNYGLKGATGADYEGLKKAIMNPQVQQGAVGGAFALGLRWGPQEADMVKGTFGMLVNYDMKNDRLGQFRMFGNVKAFKEVLDASAQILYEDNTPGKDGKCPNVYKGAETRYNNCQYFNLSITVDISADLKEATQKLLGDEADKFLATCDDITKGAKGKMDDTFGAKTEDKVAGQEESDKKESKNVTAKCGAEINFEFEYRHYVGTNEGDKWHFYFGKPAYEDRCKLTFFDIKIGKSPTMIRAYAFADGYFCLGNELPDNGKLPELPSDVANFLEKGSDNKDVQTEGGALSAYQEQKEKMLKEGPGGDSNIKFGVQFGARIGCDFEVEAIFAYARMGGQLGFDLVLKQYADNCLCSDGSRLGGKKGYYSMGQMYAYIYGELGLILDLGIWSGKWPLGKVELGAMLKGGFPNPAWAYGKVRAHAEVLGGLFKVNKTIELKVGRVCVPMMGDPLMSIQIFDDFGIGYGDKETGWNTEKAVDVITNPTFATSVEIGKEIELLDEDRMNNYVNDHGGIGADNEVYKAAEQAGIRTYKFILAETSLKREGGSNAKLSVESSDNMNFTLANGTLDNDANYTLHYVGQAKELRRRDNNGTSGEFGWYDPIRRDPKTGIESVTKFEQDTTLYFCTGQMSDDIAKYVGMITPFDEKNSTLSEVAAPTVSLKASMDDKYYDPQYKWVADLEVWNEGTKSYEYLDYDARNPYADSKYSCIPINYYEEKGMNADGINYKFYILEPNAVSVSAIKPNTKYRWSFYKFEETGYTAFIKEEEKKFISLMSTIAISAQVQKALNETQGLAGSFAGTETNSSLSTDEKAQGESMSALMNEFAQSSASTDQELIDLAGQEDVLRRVNVLREEMKNGLGQYRIMCLQFETTTGEYLTVKEQISAYLADDNASSATALSTKRTINGLDNKEYTLKAKIGSDNNRTDIGRPMVMPIGYDGVINTEPYHYNPYYVLNVWGAKAMRPLSTYDRSYCSNTMEVHYFNHTLGLADREKGTTLNIMIGGTYRSSDASLWRNYPDDKVYNMGAYDHYGTDYEVINALFNPMMSNQWIPINGRFKDLSMQVTDLLSHDCSLVKKLQTSIKNKWKNMTANLGDWKDADNNWNNASYKFEREPERYAKLTTGQDDTYREKVSTTKYYTNDKVGEIYYPLYQLPLINILRWNSIYNRTSGKPVDHWPAHVNDNCELVTTTKEEVVYAADIMSNKLERDKSHDFKGDDYKTIVDKLQFLVMRPNAYNAADFKAGDIADVNNIADILAGKPKVMHRVMVRPSTEPEYIFNLSVKPGERRQSSNPSGNYWTTTASEIDGFSESDLVWIASPCLRKYLANKLNAELKTSYTDDSKFATSHLSTVTEIISTDNWTEDAKTAFEGADLLANLKKIDVKFAKYYSGITLDLRKCKKLEYVKIQNLDAEKVILSGLDKLAYLNITAVAPNKEGSRSGTYGAGISYIDLSDCKELTQLYLSNHNLTGVEGLSDLTKLVRLNLCGNQIASLDVTVLPNLNGRYTYLGGQFYHRSPNASDAGTWVSDFWYLNQSKGCRQFLSLRASRQFEDDYGREAMTPEEMRAFASSYQTLGSQYYKGMFDGLYYPQDAEKYGALMTGDDVKFGVKKRDLSALALGNLQDKQLINAIINEGARRNVISRDFSVNTDGLKEGTYDYNSKVYAKWLTSEWTDWLNKIDTLNAAGLGIKTIEYKPSIDRIDHLWDLIPNLKKLNLNDNTLSTLDISGFDNLQELRARNNLITQLTLSEKAKYTDIDLSGNSISLLKIPESCGTTLKSLNVGSNALIELQLPSASALKELDCANNYLKAVYAPKSYLDKLVVNNNPLEGNINGLFGVSVFVPSTTFQYYNIAHIEANNIANATKAKLNSLTKVFKMRRCENLKSIDFPTGELTNLEHFDVSNCPILDIASGLKGRNMPKIQVFDASGTNLGGGNTVTKTKCTDLGIIAINENFQVFDLHNNKLRNLSILIYQPSGTPPASVMSNAESRTFCIGDPGRSDGYKINCGFYNEQLLAEWDAVYKWQANNANVNSFNVVYNPDAGKESVALDVADADDKKFMEEFPELHDRLWKKYAPNHDFFSPDMAADIPDFEIDASNLNIDLSKALTYFKNTVVSLIADGAILPTDKLDLRYCTKLNKLSLDGIILKGTNKWKEIRGRDNKYEASIKNADISSLYCYDNNGECEKSNFDEYQSLNISYSTVTSGKTLNQKYTKKFEWLGASYMTVNVDESLDETAVSGGKYKTIIEPDANNTKPIKIYFRTPGSVRTWFSHPECFTCDTVGITFTYIFRDGSGKPLPIYRRSDGSIDATKTGDQATIMQRIDRAAYINLVSDLGTDKLLDVKEITLSRWPSTSLTLNDFLQMMPQLEKFTLTSSFNDTDKVGGDLNLEDRINLTDITIDAPWSVKLPTTFNRASKLNPSAAPIERMERKPGISHSLPSLGTDMRAAKLAQLDNDNTNVDLPASLKLPADRMVYINSDDCATLTDYAQKWFDSFTYDGYFSQPEITVKARNKQFDFYFNQLQTDKIYVEQGSNTPLNIHITEAPYTTSVYFETTDDFVNTFNPETYHDNWNYYVRLNKEYPYLGEIYLPLSTHDTPGSPSSAGWAKKVVEQTRADLDKREADRDAKDTKRQELEKTIAEKYGRAVYAWVYSHFSDVLDMEDATSLDISGESVDPAVFELLPNLTSLTAIGTTFERDGELQDLKVPVNAWKQLSLRDAKMAALIMPLFSTHAHNGGDYGLLYGDFTNVSFTSAMPRLEGSFANYLVDCYSTSGESASGAKNALILDKLAGTGPLRMIDGTSLRVECNDAPADYCVYLPSDTKSCTVSLSPAGGKIMSIYFQNADQLRSFCGGYSKLDPSEWKSAYKMYINTTDGYKELNLEYKGGDFKESLYNQAKALVEANK